MNGLSESQCDFKCGLQTSLIKISLLILVCLENIGGIQKCPVLLAKVHTSIPEEWALSSPCPRSFHRGHREVRIVRFFYRSSTSIFCGASGTVKSKYAFIFVISDSFPASLTALIPSSMSPAISGNVGTSSGRITSVTFPSSA